MVISIGLVQSVYPQYAQCEDFLEGIFVDVHHWCKGTYLWQMADDKAFTTCGVCFLVDGVKTPKMCRKCNPCSEWICDTCWGDVPKRALATAKKAGKKMVEPLKKILRPLDKRPKNDLSLQRRKGEMGFTVKKRRNSLTS